MARVAMTGTAAADPAADGAGAQAPATVGPPGMRRGRPWNSSHRAHMEDCLIAARLAGVSQLRYECPGYGTATFDLKHEKAAGDREPHPWASASSYLSSQSLADSRCDLHATSRSPPSRRSFPCLFFFCRVALLCFVRSAAPPPPAGPLLSRLLAPFGAAPPSSLHILAPRVYRALLEQGRVLLTATSTLAIPAVSWGTGA